MNLRIESWMVLIASLISFGHLWSSSPYLMGAFVFVAQPLYLIAFCFYARHVVGEVFKDDGEGDQV